MPYDIYLNTVTGHMPVQLFGFSIIYLIFKGIVMLFLILKYLLIFLVLLAIITWFAYPHIVKRRNKGVYRPRK